MSEYKRVREFIEGEDAKADDVEAEFDNIAGVLDEGITDKNLGPGYLPKMGQWFSGTVHVPGSGEYEVSPEHALELPGKSVVMLEFNLDLFFSAEASGSITEQSFALILDGVSRISCATELVTAGAQTFRIPIARKVPVALAAGSHSVKVTGTSATFGPSLTEILGCFVTYLTIPNP